ncbi:MULTISPECIES: hypothetical protein [Staphylococcus]|uniref:Uncharacterized protein n=2 Tax=Staphylococcus aureus TaxID=1280 RepID=Q2FXJ3_STAA8|nr:MULTISPECIES: hypothetical protein [Staphylococcus]YP_500347.1 hypothetical protein SAOUHSC_01841 [Staphylococcus aureus subsp. aureus NCTC 8325]MBN4911711.1 hypothetical protein [Staphylococcus sp. EG-SA-13]MBN4933423.1 hypothetical protein [Staphylococcus sp. EG-SA-6]HAR4236161.1 hypothetical protein [Staphylococcus aureus ADL-121]HDH6199440.1 hypothetical protein [Staphylococcus aureus LTCF-15-62]HDH6208008.1 hypothetical protein [Staphylococcus aureus LTCF-14-59]HDH6262752.1 hypotheti
MKIILLLFLIFGFIVVVTLKSEHQLTLFSI